MMRSLGENTVRRRCGHVKQFFRAAVKRHLITTNPFSGLKTSVQPNEERFHFVSQEVIQAIIDACPTRDQTRVHNAVRTLAKRMNIALVEPKNTRNKSTCCGDSCYGSIPTAKVVEQMKNKALQMPVEEVLVYCVSCAKAMFIGGKRPRYLIDLLFNEETTPQAIDPDKWHQELDAFIESHSGL